MSDTIFSRILRGEIPCARIYEDADVLAFLDISPLSSGHTLVKAREAGLHPCGCVIKPFKERQLLDTLEKIIAWSEGGKA